MARLTMTPAVTITARRDSRWRCGVEFTGAPASFPAGHWTEAQLRQLRADPQLVVAETQAGTQAEAPPPSLPEAGAAAPEAGGRADAVGVAVKAMAAGREEASWTASGVPAVAALEAALGFDITAAERDAAWAEFGG